MRKCLDEIEAAHNQSFKMPPTPNQGLKFASGDTNKSSSPVVLEKPETRLTAKDLNSFDPVQQEPTFSEEVERIDSVKPVDVPAVKQEIAPEINDSFGIQEVPSNNAFENLSQPQEQPNPPSLHQNLPAQVNPMNTQPNVGQNDQYQMRGPTPMGCAPQAPPSQGPPSVKSEPQGVQPAPAMTPNIPFQPPGEAVNQVNDSFGRPPSQMSQQSGQVSFVYLDFFTSKNQFFSSSKISNSVDSHRNSSPYLEWVHYDQSSHK